MIAIDTSALGGTDGPFVIDLEPGTGTEITWNIHRRDLGPVAGGYTSVGGVLEVTLNPASADRPVVVTAIDGWDTPITGQLLGTADVAEIVAEIEALDPAVLAQLLADGPAAELAADRARVPGLLDAVACALTKRRAVLAGDLTVLLFAPVPDPDIGVAVREAYARSASVEELLSSVVGVGQIRQMPRVFMKHGRQLQTDLWVTAYRSADGTGVYAGGPSPDFEFSPTARGVVTGSLSDVGFANADDDPQQAALRMRVHDLLAGMVPVENLQDEDSPFAAQPGPVNPVDAMARWVQVCGGPWMLEQRAGLTDVIRWWSVLGGIEPVPGALGS